MIGMPYPDYYDSVVNIAGLQDRRTRLLASVAHADVMLARPAITRFWKRKVTDRRSIHQTEAVALGEVIGWLEGLDADCAAGKVEQAMGSGRFDFHDPKVPCEDCDLATPENPSLAWFHTNHRVYNRVARNILVRHIGLGGLRTVIHTDLAAPDNMINSKGPFGRSLLKSYARDLLAHFATSEPDWC